MVYQFQKSISGFIASSFVLEPLHRVFHISRQGMFFQKHSHEICMWRWASL
jgi:hypothetical protein